MSARKLRQNAVCDITYRCELYKDVDHGTITTKAGDRRIETLSSGGLWGIDLPVSPKYAREIENDELADLRGHLAQFGIVLTNRAWAALLAARTGSRA